MARRGKDVLLSVLAATPATTLAAVSTSNGLYLRNQQEFHHDLAVLTPFLAAFVGLLALGSLLVRWRHARIGRLPFWLYELGTPAVLCYGFLPVYRKLNVFTLSEYLRRRYDERSQISYAVIIALLVALSF